MINTGTCVAPPHTIVVRTGKTSIHIKRGWRERVTITNKSDEDIEVMGQVVSPGFTWSDVVRV